ncbi:MAG: zinc finger domain-containing protein, partial [Wohlfahrtiimonas sp.]
SFIMDQKFVVGVGNIYANEALFMSGIHPEKPTQDLKPKEQKSLVESIKIVLSRAIGEGGTTLKDFVQPDGTHGYFAHSLSVYGRDKAECVNCGKEIQKIIIAQRSTYFCPICQKR